MARRTNNDAEPEALRRWLAENGCAFDLLPEEEVQQHPLRIVQGGPAESTIFRTTHGLTGFWVRLEIANRTKHSVRIAEVQFELQAAPEMHFALLDPPDKGTAIVEYEFPGGFRLPWDQVLNHRIPGIVQPNRPWEGFFCGYSFEQLPRSARGMVAEILLFDDFRLVGCAELAMVVDADTHGQRGFSAKRNVHRGRPTEK